MKPFSFLSLRQWLTLPYVVLVSSVALLIGTLSYRTGSDAVDMIANHLLQETVARIGQAVDRHIVGSAAVLEVAFPKGMPAPSRIEDDIPGLRTRFWIATSLHTDPNNYVYYGNRLGQYFGLLRHSEQDAELRYKFRPEQQGQLQQFSGFSGQLQVPTLQDRMFDPRTRPWYKAGESSRAHVWTSVYIDFRSGELVATRARRVVGADGEFQGVVATDLSLENINEFVRKLQISTNAIAFVFEPNGELVASSLSPNMLRLPDGSRARINAADSGDARLRAAYAQVRGMLASGSQGDGPVTQRFNGPDGEAIELAYDHVRDDAGLDWIIVVAVPRSDFMHGVTENVLRAIVIGVFGALLAVALGLGILEWVGADIRRLTQAAQNVGEGQMEVPLEVHRKDEIGVLANTFRQMQYRLRTDMLTGLDNRDMMMRCIADRLQRSRRAGDESAFTVLFVDLNRFKQINDCFGHDAGDRVLMEFASRLREATRTSDRVARYAGDEFVLMINDIPSREIAEQVRLGLEQSLCQPLKSIDVTRLSSGLTVGGAVGLAFYPGDGESADDLIKHADRDMYERKRASRAVTEIRVA